MTTQEFSNQFDVLVNNYLQSLPFGSLSGAVAFDEYEKSVFLTKAQEEIIKNYFSNKGNRYFKGFDDSAKRQADFSKLIIVAACEKASSVTKFGSDSNVVYKYPTDVMFVLNESATINSKIFDVVPIRYEEYSALMARPYHYPLKRQCWRLISSVKNGTKYDTYVEVVTPPNSTITKYSIRYVRKPGPIILEKLTNVNLSIDGKTDVSECEVDPVLHQDILQRAVEIAKSAYMSAGNEGQGKEQGVLQFIQTGARTE